MGAGSDRHRHQGCLKGGAAEEFDDRGADAGCVDDERAVRARRVAGLDGPAGLAGEGAREAGGRAGGGRGHGGRDSRDEGQVGQAERVANGRAEDEAEFGKGLVGDGIGASQGNGEALEEDEGGGVAAAAEVEAEEQVRFGVGTGGEGRFVEEGSHGMARVNCKARGWPRQGAVRAGCGEVFWMERVAGDRERAKWCDGVVRGRVVGRGDAGSRGRGRTRAWRPELSLPAQGTDTSVHRCGLLKGWTGSGAGTEVSDPDAGASAGRKRGLSGVAEAVRVWEGVRVAEAREAGLGSGLAARAVASGAGDRHLGPPLRPVEGLGW